MEVTINNSKVYIYNPNSLQEYIQDCLNEAVDRLKEHNLAKENPLRYVIQTLLGMDRAHDPKWLPHTPYAKDNLADTQTALKFIAEHYKPFKEQIEKMISDFGSEYYEYLFSEGFDLVKLLSSVYHAVVDEIAHQLEMRD